MTSVTTKPDPSQLFVIFDTRAVFVIAPTVSLSINAAWFHSGKVSTRILARNAVPEMAAGRFVGTCGGRSRRPLPSAAMSHQLASRTKLRPLRRCLVIRRRRTVETWVIRKPSF